MKHSIRNCLLLACGLVLSLFPVFAALAQDQEEKKEENGLAGYPAREVERPLVLRKKIIETIIDVHYLNTPEFYNDQSAVERGDHDYRMTQSNVCINYGLTNNWQIGLLIPFLQGKYDKAEGGGLGDLAGEVEYQPLSVSEVGDLGLYLRFSVPTGQHDYHIDAVPHSQLSGMDKKDFLKNVSRDKFLFTEFRTGDPQTDYFPGLAGQLHLGNLALRVRAEYIYTAPNTMSMDFENNDVFNVNVNPGDGVKAQVTSLYQILDILVAGVDLNYTAVDQTTFDGHGIGDDWNIFTVGPILEVQITPAVDFILGVDVPVTGHNTPAGIPVYGGIRTRFSGPAEGQK